MGRFVETHPVMLAKNLNEVATVPSDALSFTPTMAELAMSNHNFLPAESTAPIRASLPRLS